VPKSDARRFATLIEPHLEVLFRAAFRLARNKPDAEDLVQETCVRACQRISTFDQTAPVKAWLLRVMYNVFVDGTRRVQRSPTIVVRDGAGIVASSPGADPDPEELASRSDREALLQRAWSRLGAEQRALLALRAEGYRLSEIAEIAAVAENVVHARLYRARRSLARQIENEEVTKSKTRMESTK
jgi:RNA polymerase sigma-70 factor (ECF subfamily)